jgi:hypothetical protein
MTSLPPSRPHLHSETPLREACAYTAVAPSAAGHPGAEVAGRHVTLEYGLALLVRVRHDVNHLEGVTGRSSSL